MADRPATDPAAPVTVPDRERRQLPGWLVLIRNALRTPRGVIGSVLVGFVVAVAALGPALAPYSPTAFSTIPFAPPNSHNLLGGDVLGRDHLGEDRVASRVVECGQAGGDSWEEE